MSSIPRYEQHNTVLCAARCAQALVAWHGGDRLSPLVRGEEIYSLSLLSSEQVKGLVGQEEPTLLELWEYAQWCTRSDVLANLWYRGSVVPKVALVTWNYTFEPMTWRNNEPCLRYTDFLRLSRMYRLRESLFGGSINYAENAFLYVLSGLGREEMAEMIMAMPSAYIRRVFKS